MPTHAAAAGAGTVVPVRPEAGVASNAIRLRALTNTNVRGRSIWAAVHVCGIRPALRPRPQRVVARRGSLAEPHRCSLSRLRAHLLATPQRLRKA